MPFRRGGCSANIHRPSTRRSTSKCSIGKRLLVSLHIVYLYKFLFFDIPMKQVQKDVLLTSIRKHLPPLRAQRKVRANCYNQPPTQTHQSLLPLTRLLKSWQAKTVFTGKQYVCLQHFASDEVSWCPPTPRIREHAKGGWMNLFFDNVPAWRGSLDVMLADLKQSQVLYWCGMPLTGIKGQRLCCKGLKALYRGFRADLGFRA